jgi:hypothetical protein
LVIDCVFWGKSENWDNQQRLQLLVVGLRREPFGVEEVLVN